MKKLLISLIGLSFVAGSIKADYTFPQHQLYANCAFSPATFRCNEEQKKGALAWFIDTPIDTVMGMTAYFGARFTQSQKPQLIAIQTQKKGEVAALERGSNRQEALNKMAAQGKLLNLKEQFRPAFDKWN